MISQDWCYNKRKVPAGAAAPVVWIERQENNMHISYKPLWHTLLERDMRKEDLRLAAGMTTNMIANMSKEGKHISMDTLARICETLNCEITDVIELVPDEPASTGGNERAKSGAQGYRAMYVSQPRRIRHSQRGDGSRSRNAKKTGRQPQFL